MHDEGSGGAADDAEHLHQRSQSSGAGAGCRGKGRLDASAEAASGGEVASAGPLVGANQEVKLAGAVLVKN